MENGYNNTQCGIKLISAVIPESNDLKNNFLNNLYFWFDTHDGNVEVIFSYEVISHFGGHSWVKWPQTWFFHVNQIFRCSHLWFDAHYSNTYVVILSFKQCFGSISFSISDSHLGIVDPNPDLGIHLSGIWIWNRIHLWGIVNSGSRVVFFSLPWNKPFKTYLVMIYIQGVPEKCLVCVCCTAYKAWY